MLGPTDPAKAPPDSLRGAMYSKWSELGLKSAPNTTDNGVHASASPFEGLAKRINWLQAPVADDVYGSALLDAGIDLETIQAWSVDPQVALPGGGKGSIFDALEDLDAGTCTAKAVAISKASAP